MYLSAETLNFRRMFRAARAEERIPKDMRFREWVRRTYVTALVSSPSERCRWEREIVAFARARNVSTEAP